MSGEEEPYLHCKGGGSLSFANIVSGAAQNLYSFRPSKKSANSLAEPFNRFTEILTVSHLAEEE